MVGHYRGLVQPACQTRLGVRASVASSRQSEMRRGGLRPPQGCPVNDEVNAWGDRVGAGMIMICPGPSVDQIPEIHLTGGHRTVTCPDGLGLDARTLDPAT